MNFKLALKFLADLNKNNHKEWLDQNRSTYKSIRKDMIDWAEAIDFKLSQVDPDYYSLPGNKALNRINNNLLYHPSKPPYKDHYGFGFDKKPKQSDFYIHVGLHEKFIAGGFYKPNSTFLKSIREAIDYNGEALEEIVHQPNFKAKFGDLVEVEMLQNAPKGFSKEHQHIDLLKHKSFVVETAFSENLLFSSEFDDWLLKHYKAMLSFRNYLNKAVTV